MAWAQEADVVAWLDDHDPGLNQEQCDAYYLFLDRIRLTGYQSTSFEQVMAPRRLWSRYAGCPAPPGWSRRSRSAPTRSTSRPCRLTTSPRSPPSRRRVFGPSGRVVLALSVTQFDLNASGEDVEAGAERLLRGTRRVTAALHGSEPFPHWARRADAAAGSARTSRRASRNWCGIRDTLDRQTVHGTAPRTKEPRSRSSSSGAPGREDPNRQLTTAFPVCTLRRTGGLGLP